MRCIDEWTWVLGLTQRIERQEGVKIQKGTVYNFLGQTSSETGEIETCFNHFLGVEMDKRTCRRVGDTKDYREAPAFSFLLQLINQTIQCTVQSDWSRTGLNLH